MGNAGQVQQRQAVDLNISTMWLNDFHVFLSYCLHLDVQAVINNNLISRHHIFLSYSSPFGKGQSSVWSEECLYSLLMNIWLNPGFFIKGLAA